MWPIIVWLLNGNCIAYDIEFIISTIANGNIYGRQSSGWIAALAPCAVRHLSYCKPCGKCAKAHRVKSGAYFSVAQMIKEQYKNAAIHWSVCMTEEWPFCLKTQGQNHYIVTSYKLYLWTFCSNNNAVSLFAYYSFRRDESHVMQTWNRSM